MIGLQDIVREAAQSGEDSGIFSDSRSVLAERDIARVVRCVLDPPMLANGRCGGFRFEGATGQIERGFEAGFPASCGGLEVVDRALDPDDGGHMWRPFGSGDGRPCFEHGDGAGFVAVTPVLVDAAFARQRLGDRTDGLDLAIEVRLIVLDLDNQMGVGGCGGFESFFWQCMASQVTICPATSSSRNSFCTAGISLDFSSISM